MRKNIYIAFAITFALGLSSCSNQTTEDKNSQSDQDPKSQAEEHNDAKFSKDGEKDAQFVVNAADLNLKEIAAGKLAETNGMSKEVRDLGSSMVKDHQAAYDGLAELAKKKSITIPSEMSDKSKKDCNDLSEKKGSDFDKEFSNTMIDGHKDAIEEFEKASKECTDPDIQSWAANMLPALRKHLDMSINVRDHNDKMSMK